MTDQLGIQLIDNDTIEPGDIRFRSAMGDKPLVDAPDGSGKAIAITGQADETTETIEAWYTLADTSGEEQEVLLGRVDAVSYDKITPTVKVVPINDASVNTSTLREELNKIYGQAVAEWQVMAEDNLTIPEADWDRDENQRFDDGGNAFLSNYTKEMNRVIRALKRSDRDIDKEAYYLFVIPYATNGNRAGYMPFKKQYGFIFTENTQDIPHTAAHELAHGAFRLYHTFSDKSDYYIPKNQSENLMDYSGGRELLKYQWDLIHDPQTMLFAWAQDESEGALIDNSTKIKEMLDLIKEAYKNKDEELNFTDYGTNVWSGKSVQLGDDTKYETVLVTELRDGRNIVNPVNYGVGSKNYAMAREGDFSTIEFYVNYDKTIEIIVEEKNYETFKNYLFGPDLELIQEKADNALDAGESWNPNSYACNNVVRAYLYYYKSDAVLFPEPKEEGHRYGSGLTSANDQTVLTGEISWDGTANKIYEDLEDGELTEYFTEITKSSTETWNDFFIDIQDKANSGEIIIGVKKENSTAGHIVVFMPKSLYSGSNAKVIIGTERGVTKPIALEGGNDIKEIKPFIGTSSEITRSTNPYKFYKYIKEN